MIKWGNRCSKTQAYTRSLSALFIFEAKTVMKSPVKCQVWPTEIWARPPPPAGIRDNLGQKFPITVSVSGHLRPGLDFSETRQNIRSHSPSASYLHWSTIPTRSVSMLQPTPALISVNLTPWPMARLQPSPGLTTLVLARSDLAPTTIHFLPASSALSARQASVSRVSTT